MTSHNITLRNTLNVLYSQCGHVQNPIVINRLGEDVTSYATPSALRKLFTLANTSSIGLKSGLYGGKNLTNAPVC